jgi:uncharacterized damage-inducible protein DinB
MSKICSGFDEWAVSPKAAGSEIGGRMSSLDRVERNREAAKKYKEDGIMMTLTDLRELYAYNAWANEEVRQSIRGLGPEIFSKDLSASYRSIRGTVAHLASAEWIWLERWKGTSPGQMLPEEEFATVELASSRWSKIDHDLSDFMSTLMESDLETTFFFTTTEGKRLSSILWQSLQHLVNHSTYHRGQIATLLRQVGRAPQATDLSKYYRLKVTSG